MKVNLIVNNGFGRELRPNHFCEPITTAALIAGGASLGSTLLGIGGSAASNQLTRDNMRLQASLNKELQQQSAELSQKNWLEQFNLQNKYNLPSAQVSRLMAAGINPFVDGSAAAPVAGNQQGPSPSTVGVAGVQSHAAPAMNLAGSIRDLIAAAKEAKGIPYLDKLIESQIKSLVSKANSDEANAVLTSISAEIKREFGMKTASKTLELMDKRLGEIQSIIDRNDMEGLKAWKEGLLADARAALTAKEYQAFETKLSKLFALYDSQIESNKASAQESRASAGLLGERTNGQIIENGINALVYDKKADILDAELKKLKAEGKLTEEQYNIASAAAARAALEKEYAEVLFWKDFITDIVETGVDVVDAIKAIKVSQSYKNMSESSKRRADLELDKFEREILEKKGGKKVTHTQRTPNGTITEEYHTNK